MLSQWSKILSKDIEEEVYKVYRFYLILFGLHDSLIVP